MKLNHCHSVECAQLAEALEAKVNAYMEMMDANVKEMDRLMAKKWVGLTDKEVKDCIASTAYSFEAADIARAVEAKLKEKNT